MSTEEELSWNSPPVGMPIPGITNYTVQRTDKPPYRWAPASTKEQVYAIIAGLPVDCPYVVMSPTNLPVVEWS